MAHMIHDLHVSLARINFHTHSCKVPYNIILPSIGSRIFLLQVLCLVLVCWKHQWKQSLLILVINQSVKLKKKWLEIQLCVKICNHLILMWMFSNITLIFAKWFLFFDLQSYFITGLSCTIYSLYWSISVCFFIGGGCWQHWGRKIWGRKILQVSFLWGGCLQAWLN